MIQRAWRGNELKTRLLRSAGLVAIGFAASQGARLVANLILTRLLFPEAFGLMALVTVFVVGLTMLSDIGVSPSIQQSARGDDPDFIDTAWTIQVVRGVNLFAMSCLLGVVAAWIYGDDRLKVLLPVSGLALLIAGFNPTRIDTASRHLMLGRFTILDLVAQLLSLGVLIGLALIMQTVWSLVIGSVLSALIRLIIMDRFLPGARNRFRWDTTAASELIHFGKWIFLSTFCGFVLAQGDKAILGKYLSLELLGIYNIGYFIGGFPQAMSSAIMSRVMIPLHRASPPGASADNYAMVRKTRFVITFLILVMQFLTAFSGVWIIDQLYDDRFLLSGAIVVGVACVNVPYLIGSTYEDAALAQGDSRGFFNLILAKAIAQTLLFIAGMETYGLVGAFFGIWLSQILMHPLVIRLARRHGAWDPWHDIFYFGISFAITALVIQFHWDAMLSMQSFMLLIK